MAAFAIWSFDADERERAQDLSRRSLLVNPNSAMALTLSGWIETMCGNGGEGRAMVERARQLNPRDPRGWLMSGVMALGAVIDEDFTGAVRWAEEALAQNRRFAMALRVLAVALVRLERLDRARHVVRELLAVEPHLTVSSFLRRIPIPLEQMAPTPTPLALPGCRCAERLHTGTHKCPLISAGARKQPDRSTEGFQRPAVDEGSTGLTAGA